MPSTIPSRQQWPRGPRNELHEAAFDGSIERTIAVFSRGSINIDQGDPDSVTPLMYAVEKGHSPVAKILLNRGANVSIASENGSTALRFSAFYGHLAVTADLAKAGADLDAKNHQGAAPLHLAAQQGHSEVMAALIDAGANVDTRLGTGETPLYMVAQTGCLDAVKELCRAKANPLLAMTSPSGDTWLPLETAALRGHSKVVRELIQQVGIEGCYGGSGGVDALAAAARNQHVDIMAMLMNDGGVVDTEYVLFIAAACAREVPVQFLLQHSQRRGDIVEYVNTRSPNGRTPLFRSIDVFTGENGVPHLISPKVVRVLINAGADTSSAVRVTNSPGVEVLFNDTPLAFVNECLCNKKVGVGGAKEATEEQIHRLEAVRRLLLRVEAAHAVSWLWLRDPLLVGCPAEGSSGTARKTAASGTQLALMLPTMRRRRRGVLLAPLFRYSSYP